MKIIDKEVVPPSFYILYPLKAPILIARLLYVLYIWRYSYNAYLNKLSLGFFFIYIIKLSKYKILMQMNQNHLPDKVNILDHFSQDLSYYILQFPIEYFITDLERTSEFPLWSFACLILSLI